MSGRFFPWQLEKMLTRQGIMHCIVENQCKSNICANLNWILSDIKQRKRSQYCKVSRKYSRNNYKKNSCEYKSMWSEVICENVKLFAREKRVYNKWNFYEVQQYGFLVFTFSSGRGRHPKRFWKGSADADYIKYQRFTSFPGFETFLKSKETVRFHRISVKLWYLCSNSTVLYYQKKN